MGKKIKVGVFLRKITGRADSRVLKIVLSGILVRGTCDDHDEYGI